MTCKRLPETAALAWVVVAFGMTQTAQSQWPTLTPASPRPGVGDLVTGSSAPAAQTEWPFVRVDDPFVFRASSVVEDLDPFLLELRALRRDLTLFLRLPPSSEHVEIYLLDNEKSYRQLLQRWYPEAPYRRALFVKRGGPGIVLAYRHAHWEEDLRHECTHALLHAALPMVPLWLDEGLAEYFEVPADQRLYGHPHLARVRLAARLNMGADLARLEAIRDIRQAGSTEYRNAWAWIHFLLHGEPAAYEELVAYVAAIARHEPPGLLNERLARRLPDVDRRFIAHFRSWTQP